MNREQSGIGVLARQDLTERLPAGRRWFHVLVDRPVRFREPSSASWTRVESHRWGMRP